MFLLQLSSSTGITEIYEGIVKMSHRNDSNTSILVVKMYFWLGLGFLILCVCFKNIVTGKY